MTQETTWGLAWRMARRERRGGIRGFSIFIACLTLGVAAIAAVGSVSGGIKSALQNDGRLLLGGDVDLRLTHYPASQKQLTWLQRNSEALSRLAQMRVMAKSGQTGSRTLAEMKAVDGRYPLFGGFSLRGGKKLADALAVRNSQHGAVVEQQLLDKLGLAVGDAVQVGQASFEIRAVIKREPDRSSQVFRLGPRLMVSLTGMKATGLIQPGSLVRYYYRVVLAPEASFKKWIEDLNAAFPDAGWRIRSVDNAAPNIQRFTNRVALFLSLVGLTTLLVGGVGIATGVTSFLNGRLATIATFKSLGASGELVFATYLFQILIIAGIAILVGLGLGMLAPLAAGPLLEEKLQIAAEFGIYPDALLVAAVFGLLITLVFSLWPLARARNVPASALFRAVIAPLTGWPQKRYLGILIGLALALGAFTVATAELPKIALWFVAGATIAFIIFRLAAVAVVGLLRHSPRIADPTMRMALANLHRPGAPTATVMLALGLGLTVLTAVVLIEGNLARQVDNAIPKAAPAYYFIDIQPHQSKAFAELAEKHPGIARITQVPMLRGRVLKLGGVPAREITPPPEVAWVLRGDRGLTWSATPPTEGSTVVEGDWWPADYSGPPLVSFDKEKANAFGLKIGDTITVNLLGRPLTARIANLRVIHWNSLSINFLMIFSPGAMQGAPLSYLATAHFNSNTPEKVELALARAVNDAFPNVSAIRVKEVLADVSAMVADIGIAVRAIASVAVLAGILVLPGAIAAHHNRRVYDAVVLKVLGATRRRLLTIFALEFALLGAITAAIAALVGTIAGWAVVVHVMRAEWSFLPSAMSLTVAISLTLTLACGFIGTWRALGQKPALYLRNE
ncbi:MAG TPA: glycosyl transferase family 1 [Rhodospirillaceae bacterium]|nr:glycosyl transferase family 1 [Rhodospirillaceae bacterium]